MERSRPRRVIPQAALEARNNNAAETIRQKKASALVSLPRALSKLGYCSRTQGEALIGAGRVKVNDQVELDPARRVKLGRDHIVIDAHRVNAIRKVYLMLNKPRGFLTTRHDPQGRPTVYNCLSAPDLPFVSPVGRLDKASEGLLLLTNDTHWAQRLLDPASNVDKRYHVQIDRVPDPQLLAAMSDGVICQDEHLRVKDVHILRVGQRNGWLEVVLNEGRNRHIRRLLGGLDVEVLRLVRIAVGGLELGDLAKGASRFLTAVETAALSIGSDPS